MVSRYILIRDWVLILVVQLCLVRCSADYFWDGTEWKWQDRPSDNLDYLDTVEGSGQGWSNDDEEEGEDLGSADADVNETDFDHQIEEDSQVDNDVINQ